MTVLRALTAIGLLAAVCLPAAAQDARRAPAALSYRETTGDHQIDILVSEESVTGGFIVHSRLNDGDRHDVEMDASAATVRCRVRSPQRKIDYAVTREGTVLVLEGILGGAPVSRRITIDSHPWYQAVETSLGAFVVNGGKGQTEFWTVHPWEGNAYLLRAQSEGDQVIGFNGRQAAALRVRMRPVGILGFFWSALYWYRPSDGRLLRYEAVRGFPGTPLTVVEYMGTD
jgi:hypothetical protein